MITAIAKILSLIVASFTHYISTAPPIPPPGPSEKVYSGQYFEFLIPLLRFASMTTLNMALISESLTITLVAFPNSVSYSVFESICPRHAHSDDALQAIPPMFLAGLFLVVTGCTIRVWCYKVLGNLFTYEVTLRSGHTLITRAPYNIVRHPSYTGLMMHLTGICILHFSPGGWSVECGIIDTTAGYFIGLWVIVTAYTFYSVWKRGSVEDDILHEEFGEKWKQYRRKVPYKFFPWIA